MLYCTNMAIPTPLPTARPAPHPLARWIDSLGMSGAALCAIHCALLPLALVLLPVLGLGVLASPGFEKGFVFFATARIAASSSEPSFLKGVTRAVPTPVN